MAPAANLLILLSFLSVGVLAALDPIVIQGSKFFYKTNGTEFFFKGVAYQSGVTSAGTSSSTQDYTDPLSNSQTCTRDVPLLQGLGINAIRTYAIDPTADHSECMAMLDAAGIYVITDLSEPNLSINRETPAWTVELFNRYTAVVDAMANYTNVIGFFAGNEVTNNNTNTDASAYVKAAVRDTKAYIKQKNYRPLGVGYAADDDAGVRLNVANYFNCGDQADTIDFWGYNIYSWCGDSDYVTSGYIDRVAEFANYSAPVFFAEYGCNTQGGGAAGRKFTEVAALYGENMTQVFSGGIVFEYFEEENDYGLVSAINVNSATTIADYNALQTQLASNVPTGVNSASYSPTNTALQACPTVYANWTVSPTGLPPTPDQSVCSCMMSSLTCVAKSTISDTDIQSLFAQVCGYNSGKPCAGIAGNTTTGVYGPYSMCNATEQLSYAFNTYNTEQGGKNDACDFNGAAASVKAAAAGSCSAILSSASQSATAAATGSSSSATTSKKSSADSLYVPKSISFGGISIAVYTVGMIITGAAMVLL